MTHGARMPRKSVVHAGRSDTPACFAALSTARGVRPSVLAERSATDVFAKRFWICSGVASPPAIDAEFRGDAIGGPSGIFH